MQASEGFIHEQEFIRSFIQKERQERCSFLLSHPKRRREFTSKLPHFPWLEERFASPIPARIAHTSDELVALLKAEGAGTLVWIISEDRSLDGRSLPIQEAMDAVWGQFSGSVLSCIPGRLAFFHGEEMKSERLLKHP